MITEKEIIEILNDDKNQTEVDIFLAEAYTRAKRLDYGKVAKAIVDKIKKKQKEKSK